MFRTGQGLRVRAGRRTGSHRDRVAERHNRPGGSRKRDRNTDLAGRVDRNPASRRNGAVSSLAARRGRRETMPKLTIVIGANGAGKSTWCDEHRTKRLPTDFYNADSIAQGLGSWNSPRKQRAARELVDRNIETHLTERSDFGFESTYSGSSRPGIVRRAKEAGYTVEAIFVGTTRPEINVKRIATRVATRTGHDVPKQEVHRRWKAAQENLAATAKYIDEIEILDNSGRKRRSVVRITNNQITERENRVPGWAAQLAGRVTEATTPAPRQRRHVDDDNFRNPANTLPAAPPPPPAPVTGAARKRNNPSRNGPAR